MPEQTQRVALVTGASSGFGELIADQLANEGWWVFGTSRRERADTETGVHMRVMDVTDDKSVGRCVHDVLAEAGRLDVLVNNAGIAHSSFAEETPPDVAQAVMDTNFCGAVRVTNAVLPAMRAQRSGTVISISSLAGLISPPAQAFYAASKHALEGYMEALRYEIEAFGVHVVLVEPGFFKTSIHHNMDAQLQNPISDYDARRQQVFDAIESSIETGDDPQKVATLVARIAATSEPRLRYRVGTDAVFTPLLHNLSQPLFAWGLRRKFNLA